ncbi:MAG: DNA translocase FtsK 4TM domain-containing protein [Chloroflexota bacterium]
MAADVCAASAGMLGTMCALAIVFPGGSVTGPLLTLMTRLFGWTAPLIPAWLIGVAALRLLSRVRPDWRAPTTRVAGAVLLSVALPGLVHILPIGELDPARRAYELHSGGGIVGYLLSEGLADALGPMAAVVVLLVASAIGGLLLADLTVFQGLAFIAVTALIAGRGLMLLGRAIWARLTRPRLKVNNGQPAAQVAPLTEKIARVVRPPRPKPERESVETRADDAAPRRPVAGGGWSLPSPELFVAATPVELSQSDVRAQARVIEETLASFNVQARVVEVNTGPTVTQFGIEPAPGMAVSRIMARNNDLALRLGAVALRMEAPAPGRRFVGIEVPNRAGAMVSLRELLESDEWSRGKSRLKLALGRDVSGRVVVGDLAKMPHLLIAGATGSGKSVCINTIVASLLFQSSPDELQLVMIDPKMVELVGFNGIPHLRMPVVTDMDRVVGSLKWVVREMERRFALFAARSARNIEAFNKQLAADPTQKPMPYMVVVIDELADMMMTAGDEVERILCRLAQLARATGIHLVVATQRPSVDVITGLIKANFPTRISFAVSSQIDSRTILDTAGAEKLLGRGDMLFLPQDSSKPVRLQGAFVSDDEMQELVEFWKGLGAPRFTEEDAREIEALGKVEDEDGDELFERAVEVANQYRRVSASLLQRRLGIGYPRAARLVDQMEERGIVGPSEDGKSREVIEQQPLLVD